MGKKGNVQDIGEIENGCWLDICIEFRRELG
jgi:hypothetical protein